MGNDLIEVSQDNLPPEWSKFTQVEMDTGERKT